MTQDEQLAVIDVLLTLQKHPLDDGPTLPGLQAVLRSVKRRGLDPERIYRLAAGTKPPAFPQLPPYAAVAPI